MASNRVLLPLQGRPIIPISKIHTSINGKRGIAEIEIIRKYKNIIPKSGRYFTSNYLVLKILIFTIESWLLKLRGETEWHTQMAQKAKLSQQDIPLVKHTRTYKSMALSFSAPWQAGTLRQKRDMPGTRQQKPSFLMEINHGVEVFV